MSLLTRRLLVPLATALAATAVMAGVTGGSAVAVDHAAVRLPTQGVNYVALGDSFSSGLGLADPVKGSPDFCHRSQHNFPHIVAAALHLNLTDVTCGGATTANVIDTPLKYGKHQTPAQSKALSPTTDIVSITIGGNDLGFVDVTRSCLAISADGPLLLSKAQNCQSIYVTRGFDRLEQKLKTTVANGSPPHPSGLANAFAEIRRRAPHAKVFVVGYPAIMPDPAHTPPGGCFDIKLSGSSLENAYADNVFPFTNVDASYLHSLEKSLDAMVRTEARKAGFVFVPTFEASEGHSACATASDRFVNGVSVARPEVDQAELDPGSLHPNATGTTFLAASLTPAIARSFPARSEPAPLTTATNGWWPVGLIGALIVVAATTAFILVLRLSRKRRSGWMSPHSSTKSTVARI